MTAFRKEVAHLLRIDDVQQVVEDHEARTLLLLVANFLGDALVETDVFAQGGDGSSLAIAPGYAVDKIALGAEGVEVL